MSFFEKLGEKISSTSKDVAKKTKELADVTKLNMQINSEESNITNTYIQIGRQYFELTKDNPDEKFIDLFGKVKESAEKVAALKEQISEIKGIKKCPKCGAEIQNAVAFCGVCGNKTDVEQEEKTENTTEDK